MIPSADSLLHDKKVRLTTSRAAIIDLIYKSQAPVSAPEILQRLAKNNLKVNKTTVYRELAFLVKNGIACEVYLSPELVHYESALLPHHHHLVCDNCGSVEEISVDESILAGIMKKSRFTIKRHTMEFFGLCPRCA